MTRISRPKSLITENARAESGKTALIRSHVGVGISDDRNGRNDGGDLELSATKTETACIVRSDERHHLEVPEGSERP